MLYLDHPLLDGEQEQALSVRIRQGDLEARNELVEANIRLANQIAHRCIRQWHIRDGDDLCQEAYLGLLDAAVRFEPLGHGTRFSTYATWWVSRRCLNWLRNSHLIHIPTGVIDRLNASGTDGQPDRFVAAAKHAIHGMLPITSSRHEDATDPIDDSDARAHTRDEDHEAAWALIGWLHYHDPRGTSILLRRLGFDGSPQTLNEVGEVDGITRERVRQVQQCAILKLRERVKTWDGPEAIEAQA